MVCVQECAEQIDVVSAFDGAIAISAFFFGEYDYNGVGLKVVGETIGFVPIGASKSPNSDLLAFLILKDAIQKDFFGCRGRWMTGFREEENPARIVHFNHPLIDFSMLHHLPRTNPSTGPGQGQ